MSPLTISPEPTIQELVEAIERLEKRVATTESGLATTEAALKLVQETLGNTFHVYYNVTEVEYNGAGPNSNLTKVTLPVAAKTNAFYVASAIETYGNARLCYINEPLLSGFNVALYSTVGTPPGGTKEKIYWVAFTE